MPSCSKKSMHMSSVSVHWPSEYLPLSNRAHQGSLPWILVLYDFIYIGVC